MGQTRPIGRVTLLAAELLQALTRGGVRGVEIDRALIGFDSFLAIAEFLIGEAEAGPAIRLAIVDIQARVEIFDSELIFAERQQALAARKVWRHCKWIAVDRGIEIVHRLLLEALALLDQAAAAL